MRIKINWDDKKENTMKQAITYKFSQNIGLTEQLLNSGTNRLGYLLEYARNELRNSE